MIQCNDCGRFMKIGGKASWAAVYDFAGMCLSHEHYRCDDCTDRLGPARSNARPADGDMSSYQGFFREEA